MDVASVIRTARVRAGLTQAALARRAGTSQATVSAYESGAKLPTVATFARLLDAAGTELALRPARRSRAELERSAARLHEVLELAEALPYRPDATLRYPRPPA